MWFLSQKEKQKFTIMSYMVYDFIITVPDWPFNEIARGAAV
jgi:hypothetical protein